MAGHETTSTATTWCLHTLSKHPHIQAKLREELLSVDTPTLGMDALNALPYLDFVIRESLRVHTIVPSSMRMAMKDAIIPLEKPVKLKDGRVVSEIP